MSTEQRSEGKETEGERRDGRLRRRRRGKGMGGYGRWVEVKRKERK